MFRLCRFIMMPFQPTRDARVNVAIVDHDGQAEFRRQQAVERVERVADAFA